VKPKEEFRRDQPGGVWPGQLEVEKLKTIKSFSC
jgi:hypothetical protein